MSMIGNSHDSVESWAQWALDVRSEMFDSEASFFFALLAGENGKCPWQGAFTSFGEVIRKFDLTAPSRYSAFKGALAVFDEAKIREVGVDAAIKMAAVQNIDQRNAVVTDVSRVTEQRGCQLTRSEVARRIQQIAPTPKLTNALKGLARENDDVVRLRSRVAELERANEALANAVRALGGDPIAVVTRAAESQEDAGGRSHGKSRRNHVRKSSTRRAASVQA
jgi:hypothetical protein